MLAALLALTAVTIWASRIELGRLNIWMTLLIASIKSSFVLLYFMHIRFEKPIFTVMILVLLVTYGIFIGLTFTDYSYR